MLEEYYFLFGLAFIYVIFATIQDLKTEEVSDWLNFSFVAFALVYRGLYSSLNNELRFFGFGVLGVFVFFALGNLFYYLRVFAGGDAKLLVGFGAVLPFSSFKEFFLISFGFIFLLFLVGAVYSLIYSLFIVRKRWGKFREEFFNNFKKNIYLLSLCLIFFVVFIFFLDSFLNILFLFSFFVFIPFLYIYIKSLDKCMVVFLNYDKLREGDWILEDIKLSRGIIRKTVHGLSREDIKKLQRAKKNVYIKQGIPFVPAFLISLLIMVFFFLTFEVSLFLSYLQF